MMRVWLGGIEIQDRTAPLGVSREGIEGWWSLPPIKTQIEEKNVGSGGMPIGDVDYSARTVQINGVSVGETREDHLGLWQRLNALHRSTQTLRVSDGLTDTFITGMVEITPPAGRVGRGALLTITVTSSDTFRYATTPQVIYLQSQRAGTSGLDWTSSGLSWPLDWGESGLEGNTGIVHNNGNAVAYPTITVHGDHPNGVTISDDLGRSIVYNGPILDSAPLVIDCADRYVTANGANRSQFLGERSWIDVKPGSDRTLSFLPHEQTLGWAAIEIRDTYI